MTFAARQSMAGAPLEHLTAHARLPLSPDRAQLVGPMLDQISALIDSLDDLDLAETPIASAFDARWE